nr:aldehyde dehydrogenase family protein [Gordonia humi]
MVLDAQRAAQQAEGIPSADVRLDRIDRFMAAVLEAAEEISESLDADFGNRPRAINLSTDLAAGIGAVSTVRASIVDWMAARTVPGSEQTGVPAFVQTRPKGVVGVIGPWNFPVSLVVHPTIDALAAGNRVMIKFSDVPERTAEVFARAVGTRMSRDEVAVIRGGLDTARTFSDLPLDHIIFTGSPAVGAQVAEAAGRNLVPVTLELGGKNPVVVSADADLARAAGQIADFRLTNGGQICLCPDYLFVPRAKVDEFVDAYRAAVSAMYPTYLDNPAVVSIVNDRNYDRVTGLIDDAVAKGARAVTVAPPDEQPRLPDRASRRIAPTVLLDVTPEMTIATEEIFGPVVVVYPYDDLDETIDYINAAPSPLAAYWFGPDDAEYRRYLDRVTSGGVTRNAIGSHWAVDGAPSGGIGRSGMGAYTGYTGFLTFSHQRTVASDERTNPRRPDADAVAAFIAKTAAEITARIDTA